MRPAMRQQLIRPMMVRPGGGGGQTPVRPQTRNKMMPRVSPATTDDGDDDVVLDDDSNDEWLPSGMGTNQAGGGPSTGPSSGGSLPSFANIWR